MDGDLTLNGWESDDLAVQVENTPGSSVTPGRKTAFYQTSLCGTLRFLCTLIASEIKACTSSMISGVSSSEYSVACCF